MNYMRSVVLILILTVLVTACIGQPPETSPPETTPPTTPPETEQPETSPPETEPPTETPPPTGPEQADKMDLWDMSTGPHLRGANIWQRRVYLELDGPEFMGPGPVGPPSTQEDFDRLAALGCNYVNISHPGLTTEKPPYTVDKDIQDNLDRLLDMIAKADMFAVISFRTGPGRSEFTFVSEDLGDWFDESYLNDTVWQDKEAQDAWVAMWQYTAERYKDNPIVAGFDLMVEPNSNETGSDYVHDYLDIWDPEEFYNQYGGTLYDWNQLYSRIVTGIRKVDKNTPILVGGNGYSGVEWLPYMKVVSDHRVVYMVHQYWPTQYAFQGYNSIKCTYPGRCDIDWDDEKEQIDKAWLEDFLSIIDDFTARYNVPVAVNEFGVWRWVPGAAEFMDDQMGIFEEKGMNHALWEWHVWEPFSEKVNGLNFLFGPDPSNRKEVDNDLLRAIKKYWGYNTVRPSTFYSSPTTHLTSPEMPSPRSSSEAHLTNVSHWLYFLDVNLELDIVDKIVHSIYDMVVIDFIPSEENNTDYPMADVITQMHNAFHPKLVIAYIDIAEAEEYRTYWQPHWRVGNPEWIAGEDPDGWEENYPVAYWYDEWREIWLGDSGYLQGILDAGFDGVYMDWVEAYSDENVIAIAEKDGVDPVREMIWWVEDIAEFTRSQKPDFIVIAQNAAELSVYDDYIAIIDAISQEQIWFDGGADNDPPGDCPLPRTEEEVDTEEYYNSLSEPCRNYYDSYPDGTLHTSSEEYLYYLAMAEAKGKIIFTVDYALNMENIVWIYNTSRALGFIPFVSNRALDQYVEPVPYAL
ncbi:MAG: cellulase family glycosylhydrolase [Theionarchaea archaeon]|nr:cellulase family glycosylhydrolase [Theionarchaea archaeon]